MNLKISIIISKQEYFLVHLKNLLKDLFQDMITQKHTTTGEEMCLQHWVIVPKYFRLYVALRSSTIVNQAQRV